MDTAEPMIDGRRLTLAKSSKPDLTAYGAKKGQPLDRGQLCVDESRISTDRSHEVRSDKERDISL